MSMIKYSNKCFIKWFLDVLLSLDNFSLFFNMLQSMFLKLTFWNEKDSQIEFDVYPSLKFNWSYPGMFLKTDHPDKVPCDSGPFNISNMGEKVMNLKFTLGVFVNSKGLIKKIWL